VLWTLAGLEGPQPAVDGRNTAATPTPATDGRRVCAYFGTPGLMCADTNGRLVWARRDISYQGYYGVGFSPILVDGLLVVASETPDGQADVQALDVATGATRWHQRFATTPTATGNNRTPIVRDVAGRKIVILWGLNYVKGLALDTGEPAWTHPTTSGGDLVSSAVSDGERLFLSDLMGTTALDHSQLAAGRQHIQWTSPARANCASPVVVNGILFTITDGGIASALAADTGVLLWRKRLPGQYYASLVASPAAVYFTNSEGLTSVVAAAPAFRLISTNDLGEETVASMASAAGELYIRSFTSVYAVAAPPSNAN
jgi:outer membrane protein assembly factor BamB